MFKLYEIHKYESYKRLKENVFITLTVLRVRVYRYAPVGELRAGPERHQLVGALLAHAQRAGAAVVQPQRHAPLQRHRRLVP